MSTERRFVRIHPDGTKTGRYTGTHSRAAAKAMTAEAKAAKLGGEAAPKKSTIFIKETTKGSNGKIQGYEVKREKIEKKPEQKGGLGEENKRDFGDYRSVTKRLPDDKIPKQLLN